MHLVVPTLSGPNDRKVSSGDSTTSLRQDLGVKPKHTA